MDKKELDFMNSLFRRFFQEKYELKIFSEHLKKNSIDLTNGVILDIGCGSGYGTELIIKRFRPREMYAFDILPEQVERAKERRLEANIFVGDVTHIELPSAMFDAAFIFGMLHHVPEWQVALREISRVLKRGGVLIAEEPDKKALDDAERFLNIHHPMESRFQWEEFIQGLKEAGFRLLENQKIYMGHLMVFMCLKP